ncbi:MAG: sigma-70 family RNA polymerase sigma factor [Candidatus Dormibacteraceae bacterium]
MGTRRGSAAYASDPVGREQMILQHLPLVHHVIGRLAIGMPGVLDREDLVAHGVIGLIQAIDRYDPAQGVPFAAWASIRIRGAVIDAIRALDVVNPATRQRVRTLRDTTSRLTASLGRFPTDDEVQAALGLSRSDYNGVVEAAGCTLISIEAATENDEAPLAALLKAGVEDPAERGAVLAMIGEALGRLGERERLVLSLYYVEDLTLQEVAKVLGVHKTVVVRLHGRAIVKLRALLDVESDPSADPVEETHANEPGPPARPEPLAVANLPAALPAAVPAAIGAVDAGPSPGRRLAGAGGADLSRWSV